MKNVREASLVLDSCDFVPSPPWIFPGTTDARIPNDPPVCRTRGFIPLYVAPSSGGASVLLPWVLSWNSREGVGGKILGKIIPLQDRSRDPRRRFVDTNFILRIFEGGKGGDVVDVDWRYEVRSRVQSWRVSHLAARAETISAQMIYLVTELRLEGGWKRFRLCRVGAGITDERAGTGS